MAANPQTLRVRERPLSPHLGIYKWPITMATSIAHRATGIAISAGMALLAWGLIALASGPELYQPFVAMLATPLGFVVLFGILWSLVYHLLNGIRHLAWDLGFGFDVSTANRTGVVTLVLSALISIGAFAYAWWSLSKTIHT